ncbi:unnamed protein product [Aureobasidium vineae]|uniref:Nucleotide-diphospho-sugar transferase n=1 Tax=Aureobasidium vineae TaxID=2773715 RepID=A0A9N8JW19_9PEZI|nr:unnamed protein product [Aureobasidium vineae]
MMSSTSFKSTVRILSFLLIVALLYIIVVPAHPTRKTRLSPATDQNQDISRTIWDIPHPKPAEEESTSAAWGDVGSDDKAEEEEKKKPEEDEERPSDVGDHISTGKEAVDDEQLTEEEKAVQDYHQEHGQNQPTRDRPKVPAKADGTPSSAEASTPTPVITEINLPEIRHHTQINNASAAEHLILVVTRDESHWGHVNGKARTFPSFLEMLNDTSGLPSSSISFAILTTTESAYNSYVSHISSHSTLAKAQVILYTPTIPEEKGPEDRHADSFQPVRRRQIAIARNILLFRALTTEPHIFYYDADIVDATPNICAQMLKQAANPKITKNPGITMPEKILPVGMITTRASDGNTYDYDLNAWYHRGSVRKDRDQHMQDLLPFANSDEIFPLDTVGGTLLYINAVLVRQGLSFPWWYVVEIGMLRIHIDESFGLL